MFQLSEKIISKWLMRSMFEDEWLSQLLNLRWLC